MGRPRRAPEVDTTARIATRLRLLPIRREQIDTDEYALITEARSAGWTWRAIADALGLGSPQSAQQRHAALAAKCQEQRPGDEPGRPGALLAAVLDGLGMSQAELGRRVDLSAKHVNQVVQGVAPLSVDVAARLESATGVPAMVWNTVEAAYRDALARSRRDAT